MQNMCPFSPFEMLNADPLLFSHSLIPFHTDHHKNRACEKSKCKSICHIVQLLLQEIKKTETSYLKLTNNALFEVMAMKRAIFVGY